MKIDGTFFYAKDRLKDSLVFVKRGNFLTTIVLLFTSSCFNLGTIFDKLNRIA